MGETMTVMNILESRVTVEIDMAVVRPAEFVILTLFPRSTSRSPVRLARFACGPHLGRAAESQIR